MVSTSFLDTRCGCGMYTSPVILIVSSSDTHFEVFDPNSHTLNTSLFFLFMILL